MIDRDRHELAELIRRLSLRKGHFTLASGKTSSYYLDCRVTTLHPRGAVLIARLIRATLLRDRVEVAAVGGLTLGADPIATAVAVISEIDGGPPLPAFIVRKETKGHGTGRQIEGWTGPEGSAVVLVDDVCTTGGSLMQAAAVCESAGYRISATFSVVDRQEGAEELRSRYPFYALFTAAELLGDA